MATKLTKKQQTQLTEKLTGIIQKNNALQLRLSADRSVNDMNVNQISGALNRIHGQAIGKDLPTVVTIPVKQSGSGDPSPDNIRPITGYVIDGIGTVYGGELNIDTGALNVTYGGVDLGTLTWGIGTTSLSQSGIYRKTATLAGVKIPASVTDIANIICTIYSAVTALQTYRAEAVGVAINSTAAQVLVYDPGYNTSTDTAAFKTAMSGVLLVYEVATPETYTLTPEQMIQLLDQL